MELKIRNTTYNVTNKDIILYNGAIYQICTITVSKGWNRYLLVLPKTTFNRLYKEGKIVLDKELTDKCTELYAGCFYYRFNV